MAKGYRWVHFSIKERKEDFGETICGKNDFHVFRTRDKNKVTCHNCIRILKENTWYCKEHGFLEDKNVSLEEKCSFCGRSAIV